MHVVILFSSRSLTWKEGHWHLKVQLILGYLSPRMGHLRLRLLGLRLRLLSVWAPGDALEATKLLQGGSWLMRHWSLLRLVRLRLRHLWLLVERLRIAWGTPLHLIKMGGRWGEAGGGGYEVNTDRGRLNSTWIITLVEHTSTFFGYWITFLLSLDLRSSTLKCARLQLPLTLYKHSVLLRLPAFQ